MLVFGLISFHRIMMLLIDASLSNKKRYRPTIPKQSTISLPPEVEVLLSLGPKFALPVTKTQRMPFYQLMADVEQIIKINPDVPVNSVE